MHLFWFVRLRCDREVYVVVLLLVGRRVVQERLHHGFLAHAVLSHGRSELSGTRIDRLHCDVVDGPFVDLCYILYFCTLFVTL
jgi:hypothetical protein